MTARSISRWSSSPIVCTAKAPIEYRHGSSGREERPWPSGSKVITRLPLSASASASGVCIFWENSSPGRITVVRGPLPCTV